MREFLEALGWDGLLIIGGIVVILSGLKLQLERKSLKAMTEEPDETFLGGEGWVAVPKSTEPGGE